MVCFLLWVMQIYIINRRVLGGVKVVGFGASYRYAPDTVTPQLDMTTASKEPCILRSPRPTSKLKCRGLNN